MTQSDAWRILQRRARDAGIPTAVCNHTFRATGITAYLDNGGSLENAQAMAAHESPRTTKLYDAPTIRSRSMRSRRLVFKVVEP
jgi:site-specific recombinase XerD